MARSIHRASSRDVAVHVCLKRHAALLSCMCTRLLHPGRLSRHLQATGNRILSWTWVLSCPFSEDPFLPVYHDFKEEASNLAPQDLSQTAVSVSCWMPPSWALSRHAAGSGVWIRRLSTIILISDLLRSLEFSRFTLMADDFGKLPQVL